MQLTEWKFHVKFKISRWLKSKQRHLKYFLSPNVFYVSNALWDSQQSQRCLVVQVRAYAFWRISLKLSIVKIAFIIIMEKWNSLRKKLITVKPLKVGQHSWALPDCMRWKRKRFKTKHLFSLIRINSLQFKPTSYVNDQ